MLGQSLGPVERPLLSFSTKEAVMNDDLIATDVCVGASWE